MSWQAESVGDGCEGEGASGPKGQWVNGAIVNGKRYDITWGCCGIE